MALTVALPSNLQVRQCNERIGVPRHLRVIRLVCTGQSGCRRLQSKLLGASVWAPTPACAGRSGGELVLHPMLHFRAQIRAKYDHCNRRQFIEDDNRIHRLVTTQCSTSYYYYWVQR